MADQNSTVTVTKHIHLWKAFEDNLVAFWNRKTKCKLIQIKNDKEKQEEIDYL